MSDSNPVPGLQLMLHHLNEVKNEWFMIGIALGVPLTKLREIEASYPQGGVKRWLAEMIQYWLDMTPTACWEHVARALEQVDQLTLASSIKQKYLWRQQQQPPCSVGTTAPSIDSATELMALPAATELMALPATTEHVVTAEIEADRIIVKQLRDLGTEFSLMLSNFRQLQLAEGDIIEARCFLNDLTGTEDFHDCENIAEMTRKLCCGYIDTFNVYHLEKVATCLKREDMKSLVKEYEEKKQMFFEGTTVLEFQKAVVSKARPPLPKGKVEVTIMVQRRLASRRVLKDMELLATEVFEGYQSRFVSFHAIPGSVIVLWHVPESLSDTLEQLALSKAAMLREEGVKKVTIGGKCVLSQDQQKQEAAREGSQGLLTANQEQRILKKEFHLHVLNDRDSVSQTGTQSPTADSSPRSRSPWELFQERSGSFRRTRSCRESGKFKRKIQREVGIVIGDFSCLYADELALQLGERIEIISKDTIVSRNIGWWTGRNSKGKIGIFPAACVKVVSTDVNSPEQTDSSKMEKYDPLVIPFDEVKIKELIGMGGFGKVHRAIYQKEEVAVKVARNTSYDTVRAITEVLSDAEKFAHLAHKNMCALVGVCLVKDVCLVMEYAKGGPLSKVVHERNLSLPVDIILNWSKQIASGMEYLHHEAKPPLIHRDLKSSNILLQHVVDPKKLHGNIIKITDFGLAREIEHTTHMSGAGTYPWMAPEVIRSSEFSQKSDVWSFGVVLWELLTGEKPYTGLTMFVVAYGVGHGTLSLPIPASCPIVLRELMSACWNPEHSLRPSFMTSKQILTSTENSKFSQTSHQDFHSLQHSWKQEVHKHFEELKKVEQNLEKKEEKLFSKMCIQKQQMEANLKKKDASLQKKEDEMMASLREHFKELSMQREKRPPRIKRFSPRRLIEWLTETKGKGGSSMSDEATSTTTIVTAGGDDNGDGEVTGKERALRRASSKMKSGYYSGITQTAHVLRSHLAMDLHSDHSCKKSAKHGHRRGHSDGAITIGTSSSGDVFLTEPTAVSPRTRFSPLSRRRTFQHDNLNLRHKKRSIVPIDIITQRNRSCSDPLFDSMNHHTDDLMEPTSVSPRTRFSPLSRKRDNLHRKKHSPVPTNTITYRNRTCSEPSFDKMRFHHNTAGQPIQHSVSGKFCQNTNYDSPPSSPMYIDWDTDSSTTGLMQDSALFSEVYEN